MKKIFRLANAELNKIFLRPSMFILATVLVISLVASFFCFSPTTSNEKFGYELNTTSAIYLKFEEEYQEIENELILAKEDALAYSLDTTDHLGDLKNYSLETVRSFNKLFTTVLEFSKTTIYPSTTDLTEIITRFDNFKTSISDIKDYMLSSIKNQSVNFYITVADFNSLYNTYKNIEQTIPSKSQLEESTYADIIDRLNIIKNSFSVSNLDKKINSLEKININKEELSALLNTYYYPNIKETAGDITVTYEHIGKLKELYDAVYNFYAENPNSGDEEAKKQLNEHIAQFYDYIQINKALIANNFELLRIGSKTDDEIINYNGFSGISIYNLKQEITLGNYYLDNNTFGYEYLKAFNFNITSGLEPSAYDFAFYAMQILSSLIIIFVIFFASSGLSGEQNAGTLKMTAIRPYSRNKIYTGKFIACFNVALILLLVSVAASFAVGVASFGLGSGNALIVINASQAISISPIVLMLIYIATILIDVIFYVYLAILISMLIKSTTINTAITSGIFMASAVISGTVTASWIRFIPSMHLGLFKYFTNSTTAMFSFSVVPNVNLITSLLVIIISIFAFDLIGRMLFSHKSIDK